MSRRTRPTVLCVPGLGANEKAFQFLEFPGCDVRTLPWIPLDHPKETLPAYCARLAQGIEDPENTILCGLSFGGIAAIEIAKILPIHKTILISSVKTRRELPNTIKIARALPLHRIVSAEAFGRTSFWYRWTFGKITDEHRALIKEMIEEMDGPFTEWCADRAVMWKNTVIPHDVYHIHGTNDRVFPHFHIRNFIRIKGGTHFMIIDRADDINPHLRDIIEGRAEDARTRSGA